MTHPSYPFDRTVDETYFEFTSVSPTRSIRKAVAFTALPARTGWFNLALVDVLENDHFDDTSVSDNGDMEMIFATVIETLRRFFQRQPAARVLFRGSTPARTRMYRIILTKLLEEATKTYRVQGIIQGKLEVFTPNRPYEAFVLALIPADF
jgi:hypothetical protein